MQRAIPCFGGPHHREVSDLPPEGQQCGPIREHLGTRGHYRLSSVPDPDGRPVPALVWEPLD